MHRIVDIFSDVGIRQYASGPLADGEFNFSVTPDRMIASLGQNNGHGGQVLQLVDNSFGAVPIRFSGFAGMVEVAFDHYAGKMVGGKLVADTHSAYFHVHDQGDPSHDGYFLYHSRFEVPQGKSDWLFY